MSLVNTLKVIVDVYIEGGPIEAGFRLSAVVGRQD